MDGKILRGKWLKSYVNIGSKRENIRKFKYFSLLFSCCFFCVFSLFWRWECFCFPLHLLIHTTFYRAFHFNQNIVWIPSYFFTLPIQKKWLILILHFAEKFVSYCRIKGKASLSNVNRSISKMGTRMSESLPIAVQCLPILNCRWSIQWCKRIIWSNHFHVLCKLNEKRIIWSNHFHVLCKFNEKRIIWSNHFHVLCKLNENCNFYARGYQRQYRKK